MANLLPLWGTTSNMAILRALLFAATLSIAPRQAAAEVPWLYHDDFEDSTPGQVPRVEGLHR